MSWWAWFLAGMAAEVAFWVIIDIGVLFMFITWLNEVNRRGKKN